jgi:hypothetical protein
VLTDQALLPLGESVEPLVLLGVLGVEEVEPPIEPDEVEPKLLVLDGVLPKLPVLDGVLPKLLVLL